MNNTIIVWFRNDLRIHDNEALHQALQDADNIIPIYCIDPRHFEKNTLGIGIAKTGVYRAQFLLESIQDLKYKLQDLGGDLIVRSGKPEEVIFALAKFHQVKAVYCQQEITSEEVQVEELLENNLITENIPIDFFWGSTLFHYDDLPYEMEELPDVFTEFRKNVEQKSTVRNPFPSPNTIPVFKAVKSGDIPSLQDLGYAPIVPNPKAVLPFKGGETAALLRLKSYFWEGDHLRNYKTTRNQMLGANYSSKFSPWLANGCISPRSIFKEITKYENTRIKNQSTYWLFFELIWRDYFRFVALKYGTDIFKYGGIKQIALNSQNNKTLFACWCKGQTGIPLIDANMRELAQTGFMSNRGRQNVASFLVHDMQINWQWGAAYFESLLIDYDPCSNYGNWNYIAGIGNDPRPNRYFNILTQTHRYDPDAQYIKYWCKELNKLPTRLAIQPYLMNTIEQNYLKVHLGKTYPSPCINLPKWKAKA